MSIIAPSVLSANFLNLKQDIEALNRSQALWIHYDVMDGHFVPNHSFGPSILKQINKVTDRFIDVHIMVSNPFDFVEYFSDCHVDMMTFHYEALEEDKIDELINLIHSKGWKAGISVKPNTPAEKIQPWLNKADMVLVMSVEPGFGGQKFMPDMLTKCDYYAQYREMNHLNYLIEIDGGINGETGKLALQHHCDVLVAGSYVFKYPEGIEAAVETLL